MMTALPKLRMLVAACLVCFVAGAASDGVEQREPASSPQHGTAATHEPVSAEAESESEYDVTRKTVLEKVLKQRAISQHGSKFDRLRTARQSYYERRPPGPSILPANSDSLPHAKSLPELTPSIVESHTLLPRPCQGLSELKRELSARNITDKLLAEPQLRMCQLQFLSGFMFCDYMYNMLNGSRQERSVQAGRFATCLLDACTDLATCSDGEVGVVDGIAAVIKYKASNDPPEPLPGVEIKYRRAHRDMPDELKRLIDLSNREKKRKHDDYAVSVREHKAEASVLAILMAYKKAITRLHNQDMLQSMRKDQADQEQFREVYAAIRAQEHGDARREHHSSTDTAHAGVDARERSTNEAMRARLEEQQTSTFVRYPPRHDNQNRVFESASSSSGTYYLSLLGTAILAAFLSVVVVQYHQEQTRVSSTERSQGSYYYGQPGLRRAFESAINAVRYSLQLVLGDVVAAALRSCAGGIDLILGRDGRSPREPHNMDSGSDSGARTPIFARQNRRQHQQGRRADADHVDDQATKQKSALQQRLKTREETLLRLEELLRDRNERIKEQRQEIARLNEMVDSERSGARTMADRVSDLTFQVNRLERELSFVKLEDDKPGQMLPLDVLEKRQERLQRMLRDCEAKISEARISAAIEARSKELQRDAERLLCKICLENRVELCLEPCHHVCVCCGCVEHLRNRCPICRQAVESTINIFLV